MLFIELLRNHKINTIKNLENANVIAPLSESFIRRWYYGRTYESQSHVRNCLELEIIELAMVAYIRAF